MSEKAQLSISGMSCAACVRRVEQGLADLKGVSSAEVNFATQKATVAYDPTEVDTAQMAVRVKDLGYEVIAQETAGSAPSERTLVSIGGMTCAACVRRVENVLQGVEGVTDASVNLATGKAALTHGPG